MANLDSNLEFDLEEWKLGWRNQAAGLPVVSLNLIAASREDVRRKCGKFGIAIFSIRKLKNGSWQVIAEATMSSIEAMAESDDVVHLRAAENFEPDLDLSRNIVKLPTYGGTPPKDVYTGNNALIGIIDSGFNIFHDAFRNADGSTRVVALWIVQPRSKATAAEKSYRVPAPKPFAYGSYYDCNALNEILGVTAVGADRKFELKMKRNDIIRHVRRDGSHGTHVAGIAGGNGKRRSGGTPPAVEDGPYAGIARDSEFILVACPRADHVLADAVGLIDKIAEGKARKPSAINISMTRNTGPHTKGWPVANELAEASERSKFVTVGAIGNAGNKRLHAAGRLGVGDSATIAMEVVWSVLDGYTRGVTAELWAGYDVNGTVVFDVTDPAGRVLRNINVDKGFIRRRGLHPLAIKAYVSPFDPGYVCLWVHLRRSKAVPEESQPPWKFTVRRIDAGTGNMPWHFFSSKYVLKRPDAFKIVSPTPEVAATYGATALGSDISVGSIRNDKLVSTFSSRGPLAKEFDNPGSSAVPLPFMSAPGQGITAPDTTADTTMDPKLSQVNVAKGNHWDFYGSKDGTSMAAPHVSGAIAILRQVNDGLSKAQIIEILKSSAEPVGDPASHKFTLGHGWLNIEKAIEQARSL